SGGEIILQCGGKIDETRTRLNCAMPALRSAISKLESFSRCLPTPLVRKIFFGTYALLIAPVGPPNTFAGGPQPSADYGPLSTGQSICASSSPASTACPGWTWISATVPDR